jgi:hypothetical protein
MRPCAGLTSTVYVKQETGWKGPGGGGGGGIFTLLKGLCNVHFTTLPEFVPIVLDAYYCQTYLLACLLEV